MTTFRAAGRVPVAASLAALGLFALAAAGCSSSMQGTDQEIAVIITMIPNLPAS